MNVGGRRLGMDWSPGEVPPIAASLRAAFFAADFFSAESLLAFFLRTAFKFIFTNRFHQSRAQYQ